jgi:hypothetical protein
LQSWGFAKASSSSGLPVEVNDGGQAAPLKNSWILAH